MAGAVRAGSSPTSPGPRRHGVLEHSHRGGERGILRRQRRQKRLSPPGPHALHSAVLGPCRPDPQGIGLLPSTEAGVIERSVLAAKAATPPRGGRGEGRQKAWLLGVISRPSRAEPAPFTRRGRDSPRLQKTRGREDEVMRFRSRARASGHTGRGFLERRATVAGANADRGGSLARRRIQGSRACPRVEHALQRSVVQSWSREAVGTSPALSSGPDGTAGGVDSVEGETLGRHRKVPARALATT